LLNFKKEVRESRQLFTRNTLKGGPVTPEEVIDSYLNANRALFNVRKDFYKDLKAAETLGTDPKILIRSEAESERISKKDFQLTKCWNILLHYTIIRRCTTSFC
jgi:hypothetical protein